MTLDRDTFTEMRAFLAAVEEGSFSKAATGLGLTPSASHVAGWCSGTIACSPR
jgi:hypothetical protein